jgi:hypothetical protein
VRPDTAGLDARRAEVVARNKGQIGS